MKRPAIRKGEVVNTFQGGFPIMQINNAPLAQSDVSVHAAIALTVSGQQVVTGITNPATYRALRVKGNQGDVYTQVTIRGTNWAGENIKEVVTASGSTAVETLQPFKTVFEIALQPKSADGQTISVGVSKKLGLYRPLAEGLSDLDLIEVDGTASTTSAVDSVYGTFTPASAPDGAKKYRAYYMIDTF